MTLGTEAIAREEFRGRSTEAKSREVSMQQLQAKGPAGQQLPVLFDRKFDDHHLVFAMGEAIAHLNYLMHRGTLRRFVNSGGTYQFENTGKS